MIDPKRHVPLSASAWRAGDAAAAIDEIVADALAHFDHRRFWPAHPLDDVKDANSSVYVGAAGVIWALEYLKRVGATRPAVDFCSSLPALLAATQAEMVDYGDYAQLPSLLLGDLGTALVIMRLAPSPATAELVLARVEAGTSLPVRELMWGMPGTMLACLSMSEMTGEPRWREIFAVQADRLLAELIETEDGPIWIQDLYGKRGKYLGPVHGYAGNMIPLLRGWEWLTPSQRRRVIAAVPSTLSANVAETELGASWPATVCGNATLCQYCHGAPGIVATFADAPFTTPELEGLLLRGGAFTWSAGPLAKGSNLCHGTAGNGYAFLKLFQRTGDTIWLERARAFAVTAIAQCREARSGLGRGRYSLWTGDPGLAVYLSDCLTETPRFPFVDVL